MSLLILISISFPTRSPTEVDSFGVPINKWAFAETIKMFCVFNHRPSCFERISLSFLLSSPLLSVVRWTNSSDITSDRLRLQLPAVNAFQMLLLLVLNRCHS